MDILHNQAASLVELSDSHHNLLFHREEIEKSLKAAKLQEDKKKHNVYMESLDMIDDKIKKTKNYMEVVLSQMGYLLKKEEENVRD
tara:strand:- start:17188 stop:17445 length:258 start_codon:yes stop_codon:yes gene_type:complete